MRKLSISLVVGFITFSVGVIAATVWLTRKTPELRLAVEPGVHCPPFATQKIDSLNIAKGEYFPKGVFYADQEMDNLVRNWYAKYLVEMKEPSLLSLQPSDGGSVYRFTWLRSFHSKVVVRVWANGGVGMLSVKELPREQDDRNSQLCVEQTKTLTADEWMAFHRLLDQACIWTLPSSQGNAIATDGAWWMFEANSAGYYQVIARQSPEASYRDLCLYMLKLSALPVDSAKGEIY